MTSKLQEFVLRKGDPWEMLQKLRDDKVFGDHKVANQTLDEMEMLFKYCEAMGCLGNLSFDFSLA